MQTRADAKLSFLDREPGAASQALMMSFFVVHTNRSRPSLYETKRRLYAGPLGAPAAGDVMQGVNE